MLFNICCHFSEVKGPLHSVLLTECSQLNCEWIKRPCLPGMVKNNLLKLGITNFHFWWRRVMAFERDSDFFCWRILPAAFQILWEEWGFWFLSFITYQLHPNLTSNFHQQHWVRWGLRKGLLQRAEDVREARGSFSEGPHLEDIWRNII